MPRPKSLTSLAIELETEAKRIQAALPIPELALASDMLICARTLRRLSRSMPAFVRLTTKTFPSPPLFSETDVLLDLLSFLNVGAMVLESYADAELRRLTPSVAPTTTPWRTYVKYCDPKTKVPTLGDLRALDLRLIEARNRLVAHRLRGHSLVIITWRKSRRVQFGLRPARGSATATADLRSLASRYGLTASGPIEMVAETVLANAGRLPGTDRRDVSNWLREIGYESCDPSIIVAAILRVTTSLT